MHEESIKPSISLKVVLKLAELLHTSSILCASSIMMMFPLTSMSIDRRMIGSMMQLQGQKIISGFRQSWMRKIPFGDSRRMIFFTRFGIEVSRSKIRASVFVVRQLYKVFYIPNLKNSSRPQGLGLSEALVVLVKPAALAAIDKVETGFRQFGREWSVSGRKMPATTRCIFFCARISYHSSFLKGLLLISLLMQ